MQRLTDRALENAEAGYVDRPELACLRMAGRQQGLISHTQALAKGLTPRQVELRIRSGAWVRVLPKVYRIAGTPTSEEQDVMAATIWAGEGSSASGRCAARMWGLIEGPPGPPEITTHRKVRNARVIVHNSYSLSSGDVTLLRSIPVTTPTRTLLDIGAVVPPRSLERALERALYRKLTDMDTLRGRFHDWTRQGRVGSRRWRQLLELREPAWSPTASDFETRMSQLIREHGLPMPVRQHSIFDGDLFIARPDFAYLVEKVAVECDSVEWHLGREPWQRDLRRYNALTALGWKVLRFSWWDVTKRPHHVASRIRDVLAVSPTITSTASLGVLSPKSHA